MSSPTSQRSVGSPWLLHLMFRNRGLSLVPRAGKGNDEPFVTLPDGDESWLEMKSVTGFL